MSHHHIIAFIIAVIATIAVISSPQLKRDFVSVVNSLQSAVTQIEQSFNR